MPGSYGSMVDNDGQSSSHPLDAGASVGHAKSSTDATLAT